MMFEIIIIGDANRVKTSINSFFQFLCTKYIHCVANKFTVVSA